jgi:PD-(D/E)XK nuclease superfamily
MQSTGTSSAIKSLSYSRYRRLKRCLTSGALRSGNHAGSSAQPAMGRAQVIGDVFHTLMRGLNSRPPSTDFGQPEFRREFNSVIADAHARIQSSPLSRHLGDPARWVELTQIYRRLTDLVERRRSTRKLDGAIVHAERRLESRDQLLSGTLDAYFITAGGIALVDYKSGEVSDAPDDGARREYSDQLYFYAYLIQEVHGQYPTSLSLVGADGTMVDIPPDETRSKDLAADMRAVLAYYNGLVALHVDLESVATPSSDNCLFCARKAMCEKFWGSVGSLDIPAWNHVAVGRQRGSFERSRVGGGSIELIVERSSLRTDVVRITRLFEARYPHMQFDNGDGQRLSIAGLRQARKGSSNLAEATDRTVIKREPVE